MKAQHENGKTSRIKFTPEEDEKLENLVKEYGVKSWKKIASIMKTRTTRQCRERYINYLSPLVKNGPWDAKQDALLIDKVKEMGPRWSKITKFFNSRSDVNIKNRYAMLVTKGKASPLPKNTEKDTTKKSKKLTLPSSDLLEQMPIPPMGFTIPITAVNPMIPVVQQIPQFQQISQAAPQNVNIELPAKQQELDVFDQATQEEEDGEELFNPIGSDPENLEWGGSFDFSFF